MKTTVAPRVRSPFQELLAEAVEVERELRRIEELRHYKLTAPAFVAMAIRQARTSREKVDQLRALLQADEGRTLSAIWTFLRQAVQFIRQGSCTRPPETPRRISFLDPRDAVVAEAPSIGATGLLELFAVASLIAADRHPDAFGENTDWEAWTRRRETLRERRTVLLQRVEREFGGEELAVTFGQPCGSCRRNYDVGFKIANGEVQPGPGCGERLVAWLITHDIGL